MSETVYSTVMLIIKIRIGFGLRSVLNTPLQLGDATEETSPPGKAASPDAPGLLPRRRWCERSGVRGKEPACIVLSVLFSPWKRSSGSKLFLCSFLQKLLKASQHVQGPAASRTAPEGWGGASG